MKTIFRTGLIFTAMGQYSNTLIQLVINMILSRLIPVEDFGIIATVQVFLVFFQNMVSAGMGPAIIQDKKLKGKDYGVLFNYTAVFAITFAILFGFLGGPIAHFYHNKIYTQLFWAMSIIIIAEGMNVVPTALLNKELRFKTLNTRLLICNLAGAIVGVIAAFSGLGVYTLIISTTVPAVGTLIINFFIVKIEYTTSFALAPLKEIAKFSIHQLGFNLTNYFSKNTDNLLVGKFLGEAPLANYQKSYQLITLPNIIFIGILGPVLQPILAKHEEDVALIKTTFLKIVHVLALVTFPLAAFMVINAESIIIFLFGKNWFSAVLPFAILASTTWAQTLTAATASIFMARNQSKLLLISGLIATFNMVLFTSLGIFWGSTVTVAIFVAIFYLVNFITTYWILMKKVLNSNFMEILKQLIKPFVFGVTMLASLYVINGIVSIGNNFLSLVVNGICFLVLFSLLVIATGELKEIKELF
ncbi:lipopolysaccharide biosynthesis protein [Enterococcus faecalis]